MPLSRSGYDLVLSEYDLPDREQKLVCRWPRSDSHILGCPSSCEEALAVGPTSRTPTPTTLMIFFLPRSTTKGLA